MISRADAATRPGRTESAVAPPRFAAFDGVRAVAVLLVFVHHLLGRYMPGAWLGVDLFFALSGYLITALLLSEYDLTGRIALQAFYIRRGLRLIPALVVFVAIVTPVAIWAGVPDIPRSAVAAVTYTMDIFDPVTGSGEVFSHTWSLAVEEQFYLVWPLVLAVGLQRRWPLLRAIALVAGASSAAGAIVAVAVSPETSYASPLPHLATLIGGVMLALALHRGYAWTRLFRSHAIPLVAVVTVGIVAPLLDKTLTGLYFGGTVLIGVPLVAVVGYLVTRPAGVAAQGLSLRPLVWLGQRSYGFYLWHFPIVWVAHHLPGSRPVGGLFAIAATLVLTELSWRLVERPALRLKSRFASPAELRTERQSGTLN